MNKNIIVKRAKAMRDDPKRFTNKAIKREYKSCRHILNKLISGDIAESDLFMLDDNINMIFVCETINRYYEYAKVSEFKIELEGQKFKSASDVTLFLKKGNRNRVIKVLKLLCSLIPNNCMSVLRADIRQAISELTKPSTKHELFCSRKVLTIDDIFKNRDSLIYMACNRGFNKHNSEVIRWI